MPREGGGGKRRREKRRMELHEWDKNCEGEKIGEILHERGRFTIYSIFKSKFRFFL